MSLLEILLYAWPANLKDQLFVIFVDQVTCIDWYICCS